MKAIILFCFSFIILSTLLSQSIICVDPGHGGSDPGAVGHGLQEKNINLDVANRFYSLLKNAGYKPYLTRSNDSTVSLSSRTTYANNLGAHRFISIHCNAANQSANGTETFCYSGGSSTSFRLRDNTNPFVVQALNTKNRGCKTADFYVVKYTSMPAILCELAFIDNASDAAKLGDAYYRQKAAEALLSGLKQTGREAEESAENTNTFMAPRWSPDGSNLIVTTPGYHGIYLVSVSESRIQAITTEKKAGYRAAWLSAHEISYQVQEERGTQSCLISTDSMKKERIVEESNLVFDEEGAIWMNLGKEKQCLSDGKDIYFRPVLSPDKTMVAYESLTSGIYVAYINERKTVSLGHGNNPCWTPDSTGIVCDLTTDNGQEITSSDLWLISVHAPESRTNLTHNPGFLAQRPSVSPDGQKIAFDARGKIYVAELGKNLIKNCIEISTK